MAQLKKGSTVGGMPLWHSGNIRLLFEVARAQGLINDKSVTGDWLFNGAELLYQDTQKVISLTSKRVELNAGKSFIDGVKVYGDLIVEKVPTAASTGIKVEGKTYSLMIKGADTSISGGGGILRLGLNSSEAVTTKLIMASDLYTEDGSTRIAGVDGKLYDLGERVFSPNNPPPIVVGSNRLTNSGYGTGEGGRLTVAENINTIPVQNYTFQFDNFEKTVKGTVPPGAVDNYNSLLTFQRHKGVDYLVQLAFVGDGSIQYRPTIGSAWDRIMTKSYTDTLYCGTTGDLDVDFNVRTLSLKAGTAGNAKLVTAITGANTKVSLQALGAADTLALNVGGVDIISASKTALSTPVPFSAQVLKYNNVDINTMYLGKTAVAVDSAKLGDIAAASYARKDILFSDVVNNPAVTWWGTQGYANSYYINTGAGGNGSGYVFKVGGKANNVWFAIDDSRGFSVGISADNLTAPIWSKLLSEADAALTYLGLHATADLALNSNLLGGQTKTQIVTELDGRFLGIKSKALMSTDSEKLGNRTPSQYDQWGTLPDVVAADITTDAFIDWLSGQGALAVPRWSARTKFSYAANYTVITGNAEISKFNLAGCLIEVTGTSKTDCIIRVTQCSQKNYAYTQNRTLVYCNTGLSFNPGWRADYNTDFKPTFKDVGALRGKTVSDKQPLTATAGWHILARVTLPQGGSTIKMEIIGGTGYNAGAWNQACRTEIIARSGNNAPKGITLNCFVQGGTSGIIKEIAWKNVSGDDYDIYVNAAVYGNAGLIFNGIYSGTAADLVFTETAVNLGTTKPAGLTDGVIVTSYNDKFKPTAADVLAMPVKKAHMVDWTSAPKMAGKVYAGGYQTPEASASYLSFGASGSNNLDIFLDGEFYANQGTSRVFHETFLPTATQVGALPIIGGTASGAIATTVNDHKAFIATRAGYDVMIGNSVTPGKALFGIKASTASDYQSYLSLDQSEIRYVNPTGNYKLYGEHFKPTFDDIGAAPISNPVFLGSATFAAGVKGAAKLNDGASLLLQEGAATAFHLFAQGNLLRINTGTNGETNELSLDASGNLAVQGSMTAVGLMTSTGAVVETAANPAFTLSATGNPTTAKKTTFSMDATGKILITTVKADGVDDGVVTISAGKSGEVYHTGNKPTAADVGAVPIGGGVLTGVLTLKAGLKSALVVGTGTSVRYSDGGGTWWHALAVGGDYVLASGLDASPTHVMKLSSSRLQLIGSVGLEVGGYLNLGGKLQIGPTTTTYLTKSGSDLYVAANDVGGIVYLEGKSTPKVRIGTDNFEIFHKGNIPTPAEVGALSCTPAGEVPSFKLVGLGDKITLDAGVLRAYDQTLSLEVVGTVGVTSTSDAIFGTNLFYDGAWKKKDNTAKSVGIWTDNTGEVWLLKSDANITDPKSRKLKFYHEENKPTAADVGAVNKTGDTMTGNLTAPKVLVSGAQGTEVNALTRRDYVTAELAKKLDLTGGTLTGNLTAPAVLVSSAQNTSVNALTRKDYVDTQLATKVSSSQLVSGNNYATQIIEKIPSISSTGVLEIGQYLDFHREGTNEDYAMRLDATTAGVLTLTGGALKVGASTVYHQGFKPTAADVGAVPLGGATLTGALTLKAGLKSALVVGTGTSIRYTDGAGTSWSTLAVGSEYVVSSGLDAALVQVMKLSSSRLQLTGTVGLEVGGYAIIGGKIQVGSTNTTFISKVGSDLFLVADDSGGKVVLEGLVNPVAKVGNSVFDLYHKGNAPTPAEVGALPCSTEGVVPAFKVNGQGVLISNENGAIRSLGSTTMEFGGGKMANLVGSVDSFIGSNCYHDGAWKKHNNALTSAGIWIDGTGEIWMVKSAANVTDPVARKLKFYHEENIPTPAVIGAVPMNADYSSTGKVTLTGTRKALGTYGLDMSDQNIGAVHALVFKDPVAGRNEGIYFPRTGKTSASTADTDFDCLWALDGKLMLSNGATDFEVYTTSRKPDAAAVGAVPVARKVNNKPLSADVTLSAADVGTYTTKQIDDKLLEAGSKKVVIAAPAGVVAGKFYPIVITGAKDNESLYISTRSSVGTDPMNNCSFNGMVRSGGWSDQGTYVEGSFSSSQTVERAIHSIVGGTEGDGFYAVYVEARAFPVTVVVPSTVVVDCTGQSIVSGSSTFNAGVAAPSGTKTRTICDFSKGGGYYGEAGFRKSVNLIGGGSLTNRVLNQLSLESPGHLFLGGGCDSLGDTFLTVNCYFDGTWKKFRNAESSSFLTLGANGILSIRSSDAGSTNVEQRYANVYTTLNKPTPNDIGAVTQDNGRVLIPAGTESGLGATIRNVLESPGKYVTWMTSRLESGATTRSLGISEGVGPCYWNGASVRRIFNEDFTPTAAQVGALAAGSYNPRRDSMNNSSGVIAILTKDLNTCVAGDFALYEGSSANHPFGGPHYCYIETKSIYSTGALMQVSYPYDGNTTIAWRNYSQNSSTWGPWYYTVSSRGDRAIVAPAVTAGSAFKVSGLVKDGGGVGNTFGYSAEVGGSSYDKWANLGSAVGVSMPEAESSYSLVWKATMWSARHLAAMGVHSPAAGQTNCRLNVEGAIFDHFASGDFSASGNGYFNNVYVRSDERLKSNYEELTDCRKMVRGFKIGIYDKSRSLDDATIVGREIGIYAQSMQKQHELLTYESENTTLHVSPYATSAVLAGAVQELDVDVESLKKENSDLKERLERLEALVAKLMA